MTTEEKIEVIRAFDEGKEVEIYNEYYDKWSKKDTRDFWDFKNNKYRVKPQPTRLDVANEFWEKTFGFKNAFNKEICINMESILDCVECEAYKNGECESESWWNTPYEEQKGEN